ncbi:MAG TPA: hypothetical protein VGB18_08860, partial [Candidatus Thermoplasmatota archaeon]
MTLAWVSGISVADSDDDRDDEDDGERGPRRGGHIVETDGHFAGRYVQFPFDEATCTVTDLRVRDLMIFDEVRLEGDCEGADHGNRGASVRLRTDVARLDILDAPNGLIRIDADEG